MSEYAIKVNNVSKVYKLYDRNIDRLRDSLGFGAARRYKEHHALGGISFGVRKGECIGIIGTNGAGKSTLLKIITGVLSPTEGKVDVDGRISALLELGAGFNMEYTGLENIYLNGTMIGFTRNEIDARLDAILEFADIGDFINQPVRTYSSGMFVRLAFAVAINIDPEILVVDEALSVGDVFFQAKCFKKFEEFKEQGKTILFVSHDLSTIRRYCDRALLINKGHLIGDGTPMEMIDKFKRVMAGQEDTETSGTAERGTTSSVADGTAENTAAEKTAAEDTGASDKDTVTSAEGTAAAAKNSTAASAVAKGRMSATDTVAAQISDAKTVSDGTRWMDSLSVNGDTQEYGDRLVEIVDFGIWDEQGTLTGSIIKGQSFRLGIRIRANEEVEDPIVAFTIRDVKGVDITGTNTVYEGTPIGHMSPGEERVVYFTQRMQLQGGEYLILLGCTRYESDGFHIYHRLYDILNMTVISDRNTLGYFDMESTVSIDKES